MEAKQSEGESMPLFEAGVARQQPAEEAKAAEEGKKGGGKDEGGHKLSGVLLERTPPAEYERAKQALMDSIRNDADYSARLGVTIKRVPDMSGAGMPSGREREVFWDVDKGAIISPPEVLLKATKVISDMQRRAVELRGGLLAAWGMEERFKQYVGNMRKLRPEEVETYARHLDQILRTYFLSPQHLPQRVVPLDTAQVHALLTNNQEALKQLGKHRAELDRTFRGNVARLWFVEMLRSELRSPIKKEH